ncbi:MAG: acyl-CoA thioesterase domain-containing protein, partial [Planctomycetota bacterium]
MSGFEQDTAIDKISNTRWRAELVAGWRIGPVPCGGYPLAIAGRALSEALPNPDPLSVHILYV